MYIIYENFVKNVLFLGNFRKKCTLFVMVDELNIRANLVSFNKGNGVSGNSGTYRFRTNQPKLKLTLKSLIR